MHSLCVYCGSSPGTKAEYSSAAKALGVHLAQSCIRLVYGGGSVGLMGIVADAALENGGEVLGVMPRSLVEKEVHHTGLTSLEIVGSMHERKARMVEESDGFIAMPGGFGTLDELFETLTWAQLGYHSKPIGVLNVASYFDALLAFLAQGSEQGFVRAQHLEMLHVASDVVGLVREMKEYQPPSVAKWQ